MLQLVTAFQPVATQRLPCKSATTIQLRHPVAASCCKDMHCTDEHSASPAAIVLQVAIMASAMTHGELASDPFQGSAPAELAESSAMAAAAANPQQVMPACITRLLKILAFDDSSMLSLSFSYLAC